MRGDQFNYSELAVLWCIKRAGGKISRRGDQGVATTIAERIGLKVQTVRYTLLNLERASIVLRRYKHERSQSFADAQGVNLMLSVELVDRTMYLPPLKQTPLGVVVARENEDLDEITAHEPDVVHVIEALVERGLELQKQVDKLQSIIEALNAENERLRKSDRPKRQPSEHLTQQVRDVLTTEQWEDLRHRTT